MDETLIKQLASALNLQEDSVEKIVKQWVMEYGKSPQDLSLEDFREVLVHLLQDLFTKVAAGENKFIQLSR